MQSNFDRALSAVLRHEGGWADHPKDPGGPTNQGITLATFRKWVKRDGTAEDLKKITREQVAHIYRKHYWNAVKGDELPGGIDYAVFDFAVNSGPVTAAKHLQRVLGVKVDGIIGPITLAVSRKANAASVITTLCENRMAFLRSLKTWGTFGKGWTNRVAGVRALALELATPATQPRQETPQPSPAPAPRPEPVSRPTAQPAAQDKPKKMGLMGWIITIVVVLGGLIAGAATIPF